MCGAQGVLHAGALGSCVAVIVFDAGKKAGGMAHVMLPGRSPKRTGDNRYAENAIEELLKKMAGPGTNAAGLKVCLVGGADLLGEGDIHILVRDSVVNYLKTLNIEARARRLGGSCARAAWLDVGSGEVFYKEQDNTPQKLAREA